MPIFEKKEKKEQENHYGIIMTEIEQHSLDPREKEEIEQNNKIATDEFYERYPQYLKGYAVDLKMKDINNLKRFHDKYKSYGKVIIPPQCLKVDIEKLADNFFSRHPQYKDKFEIEGIFMANEFYANFPELDDGKKKWELEDMEYFLNELKSNKKLEEEKKKEQDQVDIYGIEIDSMARLFSPEVLKKIRQKNNLVKNQFYERYPQYKDYDVQLEIKDINNLKKFHDKYKEYKSELIPSYFLKVNIEKLADEFFEKHPQYRNKLAVGDLFLVNSFFSIYPNLDDKQYLWEVKEMDNFLKEPTERREEINDFYGRNKEYIGKVLTKEEMDKIDQFYEDFPENKGYVWSKEAIDGIYKEDMLAKGNLNDFYKKFQKYGEEYLIQSGILNVDDIDVSVLQIKDNIEICKRKVREYEILIKTRALQMDVSNKYKNDKKINIEKTQFGLKSIKNEIKDYLLFESGSNEDNEVLNYIEKLQKNGSKKDLTKINILNNKKNYEKNFYIALLSNKYRSLKEKYGEEIANEKIQKDIRDSISDLEKKLHRVTELYNDKELELAIEEAKKAGENEEAKRLKDDVSPVRGLKEQIFDTPGAFFSTAHKAVKGDNFFKAIINSAKGIPKAYSTGNAKRNLKELYSNQIIDFINKQAQVIEKEREESIKKENSLKNRKQDDIEGKKKDMDINIL